MSLDPTTEIFDLYQVFVNEVIGDVWLAIIIFLLVILYLGIKAKMPFEVLSIFAMMVLAAMFSVNLGMTILWAFVVLYAAAIFYYNVSKAIIGR